MWIETYAYARAGLLGNPSDGYFGKTISLSGISILGLPDPHSIHQRLTPVPDLIRIPFPRAGQCLRM
ncbi:MAG: hypothetical protein FJW30_19655, partial [Acidobacteria bacterium]|nr:hypothetical protein [Acidobacteriota bacterium]